MDNLEFLLPVAILGGVSLFWYVVIKYTTDYLLKKKMIEKGYVNEEGKALFKEEDVKANKFAALKWGLIAFFAGLALIVIEYLPYEPESSLPYGIVILFVAGAFLIYYGIVKKEADKGNE